MDELTLDTYAPLSHKRGISGAVQSAWTPPTWIGPHARRLAAYRILGAYIDNVARHFSSATTPGEKSERREYGDAALLVHVGRSKLLGEDLELVVDEAGTILPPAPGPDDPEETPEERAQRAEVEAAQERQEWLRDWARSERLRLKMTEVERDAVGLGDGVYVLGWSPISNRVRLRLFDPGFYFPVLDDGAEDFPSTVHIAWELPQSPGDARIRVRRITYRLVPVEELAGRRLAYQAPDDSPARSTCLLSDGIFTITGDSGDVEALSDARAEWMLNEEGQEIRDLDLGIDFIPVVHIPNTVSLKEHYGRSLLLSVAQVLDDLHAADTDISASAATTGSPPLGMAGVILPQGPNGQTGKVLTYGPGQAFQLSEGGRIDVIDTSAGLTALESYIAHLLKRLSVNARFPEEVLGRVSSADAVAGIAMSLSFGPLRGLVEEMRLVRDEKYRLLLKFVQRMSVVGGALPAGPPMDAHVAFGPYLPSDLPGIVQSVSTLLSARAISRRTAVLMLVEAGIPIDDVEDELERILAEDLESAVTFLEATGDEEATRERLGLDPLPEAGAQGLPVVELPGTPAPNPQPPGTEVLPTTPPATVTPSPNGAR